MEGQFDIHAASQQENIFKILNYNHLFTLKSNTAILKIQNNKLYAKRKLSDRIF